MTIALIGLGATGILFLAEAVAVPTLGASTSPQASGGNTVEWAKAIAPVAAAFIAVGGVALTAYFTLRRGILDARYQYAAEMLRFRLRQVQEFYAPALLLVEQSAMVYEKLKWTITKEIRDFDVADFGLLDHIAEFNKNDKLRPLVSSIMQIGDHLTKLISEKSGLIEGGLTATFIQYQAHYSILKAASESGHAGPTHEGWREEFGYYPRSLNHEIREGYKVVLTHLENYATAGDKIVSRLLGQKAMPSGQYSRQPVQNQLCDNHVKK